MLPLNSESRNSSEILWTRLSLLLFHTAILVWVYCSVCCFCSQTWKLMLLQRHGHRFINSNFPAFWLTSYFRWTSVYSAASQLWSALMLTHTHLQPCYHCGHGIQSTLHTPLSSCSWVNLQREGWVLIRESLVRCVVRPLWSPRSLVFFVPWKPGDTVTARGRKELSVVETAGNTCFTHPSRGPWRIEERQLVGLTGNAMVTVSTAAPMATQAKRPATTGHMKSYVFG